MADDYITLPATGTKVRTRNRSGLRTQAVALDLGTSSTEAFAEGTVPVTVSGVPTTVHPVTAVSVTPTLQVAEYVTGNAMGGLLTLANAARVSAGTGRVVSVQITDVAANTTALDAILFSANPSNSTVTDRTAVNIVAADAGKIIGGAKVTAGDYSELGDVTVATKAGFEWPFSLPSGTSLYGIIVARGTVTPGSTTDLTLRVGVVQS